MTQFAPESYTDTAVAADVDDPNDGACAGGPSDLLHGHADWPDITGIPFNYNLSCSAPNWNNAPTATAPTHVWIP